MIGHFGIDGQLYRQDTLFDCLSIGPDIILSEICRKILEYQEADSVHKIIAVGVAIAGPYYSTTNQLGFLTGHQGWENIQVQYILEQKLPFPVFLEHDAKASAFAEWLFGEISPHSRVLATLCMNQGLGAGIMIDGELLEGHQGVAGEIGHISVNPNGARCICGNRGCLEMRCTTTATIQRLQELSPEYSSTAIKDVQSVTFKDILATYHSADPLSSAAMDYLAEGVALAAQIMVCAYNPDHIILCDKLQSCGSSFEKTVLQKLSYMVPNAALRGLSLRCSSLTMDSALYGAAALAINNFLKNPQLFL